MSVKLNLNQETRPYKIEVFGLQDNFIGVLQSYNDTFLGQVVDPTINIKKDGTQTFSCKLPKFFLSETPNKKIINPRWQDAEKGVIAENTCVIKVTIDFNDELRVYPFIIDKIINKRDNNFSVFKEISGNGLAFAELGKTGYKLELNSYILEEDFKKDPNTIANINYWLDKVFPNERDNNGNVTKWLTPWCYEIRMDWRGYLGKVSNMYIDSGSSNLLNDAFLYDGETADKLDLNNIWQNIDAGTSGPLYQHMLSDRIYENAYISDWSVSNNKIHPIATSSFYEKARYIDCINSNKYNITQTLAENFEVFCTYEYTCDSNGYFKKTYIDDNGKVWTGKKVIFFNKAVKTENPFVINYEHNLQSISRIIDSSEIYTKMYVTPISSEIMDNGYISIANTKANPLLDDYILNFDYLYEVGSISDWQKDKIEEYKVKIHKINKELITLENDYNNYVAELNELEAEKQTHENSLSSSREQLTDYQKLRDSEITNTPVLRDSSNSYTTILVPQPNIEIVQGALRLEGINPSTLSGYSDLEYEKNPKGPLFTPTDLIFVQSVPESTSILNDKWYVISDDYGFPKTIFTSKLNPQLKPGVFYNENFNINTGAIVYLKLEYSPKNKYAAICESFENLINKETVKIATLSALIGDTEDENEENWTGLKAEIKKNENKRKELTDEKDSLTFDLERILGPALREGYWQAEDYEDPGQGYIQEVSYQENQKEQASFFFDEELFYGEQEEFYYNNPQDITDEGKVYYPFIDLTELYNSIIDNDSKNSLDSFCITLLHPRYDWILQNDDDFKKNTDYFFLLDGKYYYFKSPDLASLKNDIIYLNTKSTENKPAPYISIERNGSILIPYIPTEQKETITPNDNAFNITNTFMGVNSYLSKRHLYNNAGFSFSFLRNEETEEIIPVALLQNENIDYLKYSSVFYSLDNNSTTVETDLQIKQNDGKYRIVYPRIFLDHFNVNYDSDTFQVFVKLNDKDYTQLTNYEDYNIFLRHGQVYVNLKITNINLPKYLFENYYKIIYQVSRANEMLYLDALQVAKDNSKPKYSYEITKANLPQEINAIELGQLVYINDYNVDIFKEYGYISEISYNLSSPSKDLLVIENYKTKFEDLFASISAQNEAMKQNQNLYNIAALSFTPNGEVKQEVLQNTLDNNNFIFNFSNTNMSIDNTGGLILTNVEPYNNGVYGQVALRGGGLFLSNSINNEDGSRIWSSAITPEGINANSITAGTLDTSLIRIYSGNAVSFQWNNEGLVAYKEITTEDDKTAYDVNSYVKMNKDGLIYVDAGKEKLKLGWEGLQLNGADGHVKITEEYGLSIHGSSSDSNPLAIFGRHEEEYGMFLFNSEGDITLKTNNTGNLELQNKLLIGSGEENNYTGLCGKDGYLDGNLLPGENIRFWAGHSEPTEAPIIITERGSLKASKIVIPVEGKIIFKSNIEDQEDITLDYNMLSKIISTLPNNNT